MRPGDPRRSDASFVGAAQPALSLDGDARWLELPALVVTMEDPGGEPYRDAFHGRASLRAES